jgi:predicted small secreted protein
LSEDAPLLGFPEYSSHPEHVPTNMNENSHLLAAKFRDKPNAQKISVNISCLNLDYLYVSMKKLVQFFLLLLCTTVLASCASRKRGKGCDCPGFGQVLPAQTQDTTSFRV